jgi:hypothetical protein
VERGWMIGAAVVGSDDGVGLDRGVGMDVVEREERL